MFFRDGCLDSFKGKLALEDLTKVFEKNYTANRVVLLQNLYKIRHAI